MDSTVNNTTLCLSLSKRESQIIDIIDVSTRIVQILASGLAILYLLVYLRKKAVDNPAKRFGFSVIFTFGLASTNRVVLLLYPTTPLPPWICVITLTLYCVGSTVILYLVALPIALLLQVSAPIFPDRFRHKMASKILLIEVTSQLLIFIASVLINGLQLIDHTQYHNFCNKCITLYYYEAIALSLSVIALFVTIITLCVVYRKFREAVILTNKTKKVISKIFILFLATNAAFIGNAIVTAIIKQFEFEKSIAQALFFTAVKLVFIPAVVVVLYSPNIRFKSGCCVSSTSNVEKVNLLVKRSENQDTNPISVWDHSKDPSYTRSYHPHEMSDCKTTVISRENLV